MTNPAPHGEANDAEWCSVAEAARRLGVTPTAIRNRIKRRTLETKPNGNHGHLVRVPLTLPKPVPLTVLEPVPEPLPSPVETELRAQFTDLSLKLIAAQADLIELAREAGASKAEIASLTVQLAAAAQDRDRWHDLATRAPEPRRPWWRRLAG